MITLRHVSKNFGQLRDFEDIHFHLGEGEFGFFQGRSGSGKSTLLRLSGGIILVIMIAALFIMPLNKR